MRIVSQGEVDVVEMGLGDEDLEREPDLNSRRLVDPRTMPVRFSHLKAMGRCGLHCLESFQGDGDKSLARRLGSGVHAMLLGKPFAKWDQPSKAARTGKSKATGKKPSKAPRSGEEWEAFRSAHQGHVIMSAKEHTHAESVSAAIRAHAGASRLLFGPGVVHEHTILWSQKGRSRRSTPDARGADYIAELKTTRDASPDRFLWDARRMSYHAQLADQLAAIEASTGRRPREAFIVAVESARPYVVQVYQLSGHALDQGAQLNKRWLDELLVAEASNVWRGYHPGVVEFDVPTEEDESPSWFDEDEEEVA